LNKSMSFPTAKPVADNQFGSVVDSRKRRIPKLLTRNNRAYFQTNVWWKKNAIKIPMQATNIEQARREMVDFESKLNKRWKYEGGEWIKPEDVGKATLETGIPAGPRSARDIPTDFEQFVTRWKDSKTGDITEATMKNYETDLKVWIAEFKALGLTEIGAIDAGLTLGVIAGWKKQNAEFLKEIEERSLSDMDWRRLNGRRVVSRLRMKRRLMVLGMVLDHARDMGVIQALPFDSRMTRKWFSKEKEPKQERKRISDQQMKALIETARNMEALNGRPSFGPVLADLWSLMMVSGLRSSEARALRWRQIDFENGQIRLEKEKYAKEKARYIGFIGKDNDLERLLKRMHRDAQSRGENGPEDFVFRGRGDNKPISDLRDLMKKVAEKVGMKDFFFDPRRKSLRQSPNLGHHDFRRYFGSVLDENGMPRIYCAKTMRHSDNGQTFDASYAKSNDELAKQFAKRVKFPVKVG